MKIIADLHMHSKYARATSPNLGIESLEKWGKIKGLNLIGTGDFQHPKHWVDINSLLTEREGILYTKTGFPFILQTEISLMFSQGGKRRAVHLVVLAPSLAVGGKIIDYLKSKGRIDYDGRPIFGITARDFVKDLKGIDKMIEIIAAHCLLPDEKIICNSNIKKISEINIGEEVLAHKGIYKKVTNTFKRDYNGNIFKIQPYYFNEGISVTSEHPFLAIKTVKKCSYVRGLCKPNSIAKGKHVCKKKHYEKYKTEWIKAENLEVNDVLLYPRIKKVIDKQDIDLFDILPSDQFVEKGEKIAFKSGRQDKKIKKKIEITPELCRLIGYYLAEGYIIKEKNSVQFSFGKHESEYINDVVNLMELCFGVKLAKMRDRHGYELYFYSKIIVGFFETLFYEKDRSLKAPFKKLPPWMLYLPKEKQAELFKGWWRGDTGVSVSELLIQQMKLICLRLGIIPSIYKMEKERHRAYGSQINGRKIIASHDCFSMHNLSFFKDDFNLLEDNVFKKFKTKLGRRHGWIDEDYVYLPIKEIKKFNYKGFVYNLEVEEDNSYVTSSATVHNCMTPWFGIFGSDTGFDTLKDCFLDMTGEIYAIESGMSADPEMLWRLDEKVNIVSFSDAHSAWPFRIGREATILDISGLSYDLVIDAIRTGRGLIGTIETPPEYGKYHFDGHRNCNFSCGPEETKRLGGICPKCGKAMTIGVEHRVELIAKFERGHKSDSGKKFYKILPLQEIISLVYGWKMENKKTWDVYNGIIEKFENELSILLDVGYDELIEKGIDKKIVELILLGREGKLKVKPGYDGEYGVLEFEGVEKKIEKIKEVKKNGEIKREDEKVGEGVGEVKGKDKGPIEEKRIVRIVKKKEERQVKLF